MTRLPSPPPPPSDPAPGSRYLHPKTGNLYLVLGTGYSATNSTSLTPVVIYTDGATLWVRDLAEFNDPGRFEEIP